PLRYHEAGDVAADNAPEDRPTAPPGQPREVAHLAAPQDLDAAVAEVVGEAGEGQSRTLDPGEVNGVAEAFASSQQPKPQAFALATQELPHRHPGARGRGPRGSGRSLRGGPPHLSLPHGPPRGMALPPIHGAPQIRLPAR